MSRFKGACSFVAFLIRLTIDKETGVWGDHGVGLGVAESEGSSDAPVERGGVREREQNWKYAAAACVSREKKTVTSGKGEGRVVWFNWLLGGGKGGVLVPGTRLGGVPPLLIVLYRRRLSHGGGGCLSLCLVSFLALLAAQPLDLFLLTLRRCRSPRPALPRLPDLTWPGLAWA